MAKKTIQKKKSRGKKVMPKKAVKRLSKVARNVRDRIPNKHPVEEVRKQLVSYASEIEKYLGSVNAQVDTFKFAVEKSKDGLTIDTAIKAKITV